MGGEQEYNKKRKREVGEETEENGSVVKHAIELSKVGRKRCCDHCRHDGCLGPLPKEDDPEGCLLDVSIPGLLIINGTSQSGKSKLLRYIFWKYRNKLHHGIAFSNTGLNESNLDWIPKKFKHHRYGDKLPKKIASSFRTVGDYVLNNFLDEQLKIPYDERPVGYVVVDDDRSGFQSEVLIRAATQSTHHKIFVVICTQHTNALITDIREQYFQVAIFKDTSKNGLVALYDSFGRSDYRTAKEFEAMVIDPKNTGDYKFLWKDKIHNKPWHSYRCPPVIPKFVIDFAEEKK